MMDRTKQQQEKSQPKSPDVDDDNDPGSSNDKDQDDDRGSGSSHKGDQGHSKGRRGYSGCGNLSGGGGKWGRLQGGARRIDPDVNELVTIKVCLS
jgi:hypothetical protein